MAEKYPEEVNQYDINIIRTETSGFTDNDSESVVRSSTYSIYNSSTCEVDCDLCKAEGEVNEAVGYCSDCQEHYCKSCLRAHGKSKATGDHTLLDQSSMPTVTTTSMVASTLSSSDINKGSDTYDDQSPKEYHFYRDICIKLPNETNDCFVTEMVAVSDDTIVLIDQENKSVKMIDVIADVIKRYKVFEHTPVGITSLPNSEVAITFPDENLIRIFSASKRLIQIRTETVNGRCTAVEYYNGKLYVSYQQPLKFQILSLSGSLVKTIIPDAQFLKQCSFTRYIAVHPNERRLYVSDMKRDVILSMDMSGTMLAVYSVDIEGPSDIMITPFDSIYLCNTKQHTVCKVSDNLDEASAVLTQKDGLFYPYTMCFCPVSRFMFVSSGCVDSLFCNYIKKYEYN